MLSDEAILAIVSTSLLIISELLPALNIEQNGIVHGLITTCQKHINKK